MVMISSESIFCWELKKRLKIWSFGLVMMEEWRNTYHYHIFYAILTREEVFYTMAKTKKRTDIVAKASEATGISYMEIIHSAYTGTKREWKEIDEMVYAYEAEKKIPRRIYEFASFLLKEWKKENGAEV
jgi:hypothetical protein